MAPPTEIVHVDISVLFAVRNVRQRGRRSAQVPDDQEHEDAGQQHAADHDELVLRGSPLDQPHHRVGQAQHVGHVQHLLMGAL